MVSASQKDNTPPKNKKTYRLEKTFLSQADMLMSQALNYTPKKTEVLSMTRTILKKILCVGLAFWMMAAVPVVVRGYEALDCEYEYEVVIAPLFNNRPGRDDD